MMYVIHTHVCIICIYIYILHQPWNCRLEMEVWVQAWTPVQAATFPQVTCRTCESMMWMAKNAQILAFQSEKNEIYNNIYIYIPPRMHVPTGYICNLSYSICLFTYLPMCICMWIRIWLWNMQCNYLCRHTVCQNFKCTCTSLYTFVFISVNCNIYNIYIYRCCGMHGCVYTLDANVETHARSCKCEIV